MARTMDPNTATAQFFINAADNQFLNHSAKTPRDGATPCSARVVKGQGRGGQDQGGAYRQQGHAPERAAEPVTIIKATVVEEKK